MNPCPESQLFFNAAAVIEYVAPLLSSPADEADRSEAVPLLDSTLPVTIEASPVDEPPVVNEKVRRRCS